MQKPHKSDKPLPLNSFILHQNRRAVHFSDKLKKLREGPFKVFNKPTKVTHELLTQDGKTFQIHRNHSIPFYPKGPLHFPYIETYKEQNFELFHDSYTSDMSQNDLYTSFDKSEF